MTKNLWSGRFKKSLSQSMVGLSYSIEFDHKLMPFDLEASMAHAGALMDAKVLTQTEHRRLVKAMGQLQKEYAIGKVQFLAEDEDIHMATERILTERLGDLGKKLHTGRSRNDQVATAFKMYIRQAIQDGVEAIIQLQESILSQAEKNQANWMPGYTHLQQAQPVGIAHYLLSFFWALEREKQKWLFWNSLHNTCPLGSGALAGSAFPYDRRKVARQLGFEGPSQNSIDATGHRDFVLDFLSTCASVGALLSRYAEDFVIWSSLEFGFIRLDDAFTTGSSMMPQKRNPDSMELVRGKTGRLLGNYTSAFTAFKGAPLCYSRDLQEDKEPVFDSVQTLEHCLGVFAGVMSSLKFNLSQIEKKADLSMLATDLADDLVKQGIPFREAHHKVGALVAEAEKAGCSLFDIPPNKWNHWIGSKISAKSFTFNSSLQRRKLQGGTSLTEVKRQIRKAKNLLPQVKTRRPKG